MKTATLPSLRSLQELILARLFDDEYYHRPGPLVRELCNRWGERDVLAAIDAMLEPAADSDPLVRLVQTNIEEGTMGCRVNNTRAGHLAYRRGVIRSQHTLRNWRGRR